MARILATRFVAGAKELVFVYCFATIVGLKPVLARVSGNDLDLNLLQFGRRGDLSVGRSAPADDHGLFSNERLLERR